MDNSGRKLKNKHTQHASVILTPLIFLILWQALVVMFDLPAFILPTPVQVADRFARALSDGSLLRHTFATLVEILLGLSSGILIAILLGYFLSRSSFLQNILQPFLVASQAIPTVAIAPLLVIWFGPGIFSKVLICALIVFFPVLVNTIVGFQSVMNPHDPPALGRPRRIDGAGLTYTHGTVCGQQATFGLVDCT